MRFRNALARRALVAVSVAVNLALLVGARHMGALVNPRGWDWIFPLGLSFYTFQALTYTIDLYRRDAKGTNSLLGVSFRRLVLPDLTGRADHARDANWSSSWRSAVRWPRVEGGRALFLIGLGLLKKALIADFLAENLVNRVFDTPKLYSGAEVLLAVYAYSLQLYFDFSGYTDIARGTRAAARDQAADQFRPAVSLGAT